MTSFLLQFAISNLGLSVPIALIAYAVHRSQRSPTLAHLLWVLVLVEQKNSLACHERAQRVEWRRRGSNPRPATFPRWLLRV